MDLFACKSLVLLLVFIGCSAGQQILPEGPVDVILGRNVTLMTLITKSDFTVIIWNYNDGSGTPINVATQTNLGLKVNPPYEGRVSINETTGYLTLGPLKSEDSGDYSIITVTADGTTRTGETTLRVLDPTTSTSTFTPPTFSTPEPSRPSTGVTGSVIACVVVIAVLLVGYLLLLWWIKKRNPRNSNSRNMELSVPHERRPPDSEDYQTLNPATRDQEQIYPSLSDT